MLIALQTLPEPGWGAGTKEPPSGLSAGGTSLNPGPRPACGHRALQTPAWPLGLKGKAASLLVWFGLGNGAHFILSEKGIHPGSWKKHR